MSGFATCIALACLHCDSAYVGDSGQQVLCGVCILCGFIWVIILTVCLTKRRRGLARTLQHWNGSDGVTYGIHLEMRGNDGARLSACRCGKLEIFLHVYDGPGDLDIAFCFPV